MDWSLFIAASIFVVALGGLYINSAAKFLSVREYDTYHQFIIRELDAIHRRLSVLEQTRPTTGELEARLGAGKEKCIIRGTSTKEIAG